MGSVRRVSAAPAASGAFDVTAFMTGPVFTDQVSAENLLSEMGVVTRLDQDGSGGLSSNEQRTADLGIYVATGWVARHATTYDRLDLARSASAWWWATIYYARYLCLLDGNPIPPGLAELFAEAQRDMLKVQAGTMFIEDIGAKMDPAPSWSNLRMDNNFGVRKMRVIRPISDRSRANFPRRRDFGGEYIYEPDL